MNEIANAKIFSEYLENNPEVILTFINKGETFIIRESMKKLIIDALKNYSMIQNN